MSEPISFGLLAFWLAFASQHSGLPIPPTATMPRVEIVTEASLNEDLARHPCVERYAGLTDLTNGNIKLADTLKGPDRECALAHELTHYLQVMNRVPQTNLEPQAYRVDGACYDKHFHMQSAASWSASQQQTHAGGRCSNH